MSRHSPFRSNDPIRSAQELVSSVINSIVTHCPKLPPCRDRPPPRRRTPGTRLATEIPIRARQLSSSSTCRTTSHQSPRRPCRLSPQPSSYAAPPAPPSSTPARSIPVPRRGPLAEWWPGDQIAAGTPAAVLLSGAGQREGDLVLEKRTYSAFAGTGLEEALRGMGVEEVIVTGVMTNLCCETTARDAFVRGFRVFFSADATATASQDLQEATLVNMAYGFAYIVDCKRLEAAFGKAK
ncbi:hypothetical protein GUJ93_ZPchr0004g40479 [Zizania palustris]|uniref:Isochorismatase-like domain-containing protein n=1 Tax=Zizania palustris TaxID=103762 RepID=A0A8J5S1C4_ZIZPA|nr:hypothetical protein GUJ93_ZPchr0004g40479 [Zizania palustris]